MGVPGLWLAKGSCQGRQSYFFLGASLALSLITMHVHARRDQRPSLDVIPPWDLEFPEELDPSACLTSPMLRLQVHAIMPGFSPWALAMELARQALH